jgi:hypothetical protein
MVKKLPKKPLHGFKPKCKIPVFIQKPYLGRPSSLLFFLYEFVNDRQHTKKKLLQMEQPCLFYRKFPFLVFNQLDYSF